MKRFEYLEHTADILIRAHGGTLGEAFAASADAMFDIITGHRPVPQDRPETAIRIEAVDEESLVVRFLSELIVRHEVDRVIMSYFAVELFPGFRLNATAKVDKFSEEHYGGGTHIKGVPYHLLEIMKHPDGSASIRVLFDI